MKINEERFDFIHQNKWGILTNQEIKNLRSYYKYVRHYKKIICEVEELKSLIEDKEKLAKIYVQKLMRINYQIDHLRTDYHFSFSIYKVKNKNYFNCSIGRRGHPPKN